MERIRLLKEPGYVYDLMYVFCLKFNHKIYAEEYRDEDTRAENEAYFAEIMKRFGEISDDQIGRASCRERVSLCV